MLLGTRTNLRQPLRTMKCWTPGFLGWISKSVHLRSELGPLKNFHKLSVAIIIMCSLMTNFDSYSLDLCQEAIMSRVQPNQDWGRHPLAAILQYCELTKVRNMNYSMSTQWFKCWTLAPLSEGNEVKFSETMDTKCFL